ncbi:hypothetical protein LSAT2_012746 [Lamellibrachia satsuma]|nr:hypothetical protein LSAT2_012746 [Lamellibrachia satsuma]
MSMESLRWAKHKGFTLLRKLPPDLTMDDEDFEHQLQQEADERQRQDDGGSDSGNAINSGATRVDEDGTVFEFDMEKRAWFPKTTRLQQPSLPTTTTTEPATTTTTELAPTNTDTVTSTTTAKAATDYAAYYQQYYSNTGTQPADVKAYWDSYNKYCNQYYKSQQGGSNKTDVSATAAEGTTPDSVGAATKETEHLPLDAKETSSGVDVSNTCEETRENGKTSDENTKEGEDLGTTETAVPSDNAQPEYDYAAYYHYYYSHYGDSGSNPEAGEGDGTMEGLADAKTGKPIVFEPTGNKEYDDYWSAYFSQHEHIPEEEQDGEGREVTEEGKEVGEAGKKDKKGKRKEPEAGWFDVDTEKLTSVYVSGMPLDITDDEFKELMNKCGLVMYDVRTRKPKLKLYKEKTGENKGDGLCCYIKPESVELALQIIDGYEMRGQCLSVEVAQFELKGQYDPSKKKKKLSNREKKRMRKQQEKLFNWHLEKDAPVRQKRERIIIVKNLFDPNVFEGNPVLINNIRDDLRKECSKHGEVRKVIIYDRHQEGVASVIFKLAEEADACTAAMHNRMWGKRVITAEAWDGNTKYEVQETEAEREKRIDEWANFLDGKEGTNETQEKKDGVKQTYSKKNDLAKPEDVNKREGKEREGITGETEREGEMCVDSGKDGNEGKDGNDGKSEGKEKDIGSDETKDTFDGEEEEKEEDGGIDTDNGEGEISTDEPPGKWEEQVDARGTEKMETDHQVEQPDGSTV